MGHPIYGIHDGGGGGISSDRPGYFYTDMLILSDMTGVSNNPATVLALAPTTVLKDTSCFQTQQPNHIGASKQPLKFKQTSKNFQYLVLYPKMMQRILYSFAMFQQIKTYVLQLFTIPKAIKAVATN